MSPSSIPRNEVSQRLYDSPYNGVFDNGSLAEIYIAYITAWVEAAVALSVKRLATVWSADVLEFESRNGQEYSPVSHPDEFWGPCSSQSNG
jgi:hypothetical protein